MSPVPTINNGAKNSFLSFHPARLRLSRYLCRMKNGKVKRYQQKLSTQLTAGTKTTINLSMDGVLLEEGNTGGFQVDKWKEQNENIHIPLR